MKILFKILLALLITGSLLAVAVSCSSGGGSGAKEVVEEESPKEPPSDDGTPSGDTVAPNVVSIEPVNAASVRFTFNEKITEASAEKAANYAISSDSTSHTIKVVDVKDKNVTVTVSPLLRSGITYTGLAKNIEDLSGNSMKAQSKTFSGVSSAVSSPAVSADPDMDPDGDNDGDGISNGDELDLGTDPDNPDSDGDGVDDALDPEPAGTEVSLTLSTLPQNPTNNVSATIAVDGVNAVKYRYALNSDTLGAEQNISDSIELSALADGEQTLKVIGMNQLGDWQSISDAVTFQWVVDTIAPVAELTNTPNAITNQNSIDIDVRGQSGDTIVAYKYVLDEFESDVVAADSDISWTEFNDGDHILKVVAVDRAGNWQSMGSASQISWNIDTTMPVAAISGINDSVATNDTEEYAAISDVVSYKYRFNGSSWSAETDSTVAIELTSLIEGEQSLEVIGKNEAGTWQPDTNPTVINWTVDLTPPAIRFVVEPEEYTNSTKPVITVQAGEGVTDLARYKYRIDGGEWSSPVQAVEAVTFSDDLAEGLRTVSVKGIDGTGNEQPDTAAISTSFTVDITPPVVDFEPVASLPGAVTNSQNEEVYISSDDIVSYRYKLNDGSWSEQLDPSVPVLLDSSELTERSHLLSIVGKDRAGNEQSQLSATTYGWVVDITSPASVEVTNLPSLNTSSGSVDAVVSDNDGDVVSYWYRIGSADWTPATIGTPISYNSLAEGDYTLYVKALDEAGNVSDVQFEYLWTVDRTAPTAVIAAGPQPSTPTNDTGLYVLVGGDDVIAYQYSLDGAAWSSERDISSPITAADLVEKEYILKIKGKDIAGNWQEEISATQLLWSVDLTPPSAAVISGLPAAFTNNENHTLGVGGDDVFEYRYQVNGSALSDFIPVSEDIVLTDLLDDVYQISVIGYDQAGNQQGVATSASFTVDTIAPAAVAVTDAGQYSGTTALEFGWTIPSEIEDIRIQVATDSEFNQIVLGASNGVQLEAATSYTYAANSSSGSSYYARISVSDAAGNWSSYGSASDGITLAGSITAQLVDNSGNSVSGATITLRAADGTTVLGSEISDGGGEFIFDNVPVTQASYSMLVDAAGYSSAVKNNISVNTGAVSNQGIINLVSNTASSGVISGCVIDANDGKEIAGALITVTGWDGTVRDSRVSDENGNFTTDLLIPGTYSVNVTNGEYYDLSVDNRSIDGDLALGDLAICEELAPYQLRVVLLWGLNPKDLDLHLVGPTAGTDERFHIYWSRKSYDENSKNYVSGADPAGERSTASLVQDETNSYGPEAINIFDGYEYGIFTYTVHNWSGTDWYASNLVIRVYDSQGLYQEIPFPTGAPNEWYWKIFQIKIEGENRADREIWIENGFASLNYGNSTSMDWSATGGGLAGFIIRVATGNRTVILLLLGLFAATFAVLVHYNRYRIGRAKSAE